MRYSELPAPEVARHAIKLAWALEVDGLPGQQVGHVATPDGCMEIIRRVRGRSFWKSQQPECFVAGVIRKPAQLLLAGDSVFVGVRLWPWAWNAFANIPAPRLVDCWAELARAAPSLRLPRDVEGALDAVASTIAPLPDGPLVAAILESRGVAELAERSGRSHRWLQRWFQRHVGIAPGAYLRLLRFSDTLTRLPGPGGSLAGHAAEHGFADQAHMSREFKTMAGASAGTARRAAVGPFVPAPVNAKSPS